MTPLFEDALGENGKWRIENGAMLFGDV